MTKSPAKVWHCHNAVSTCLRETFCRNADWIRTNSNFTANSNQTNQTNGSSQAVQPAMFPTSRVGVVAHPLPMPTDHVSAAIDLSTPDYAPASRPLAIDTCGIGPQTDDAMPNLRQSITE
ncbi:hypothetical protein P170DRAFT_432750 [Aspergillus steynii IBT 23096]|uniref:Uncharacterized protein n=1 Tax=Aspergillus steynii IBT 23096 TaxID=1392250 RepID=A0A2I2GQR1_9EURO|nr:uncharacterized protein P170DRAFT_432750 [Aspergillus steynii IBT 23096]PLB55218.1 hypothetical protein P170DRAFT_432750 [Aspergillus steynii IBT 23096]